MPCHAIPTVVRRAPDVGAFVKFSLATLLVLVLLAAIGCAALTSPNDLWRQAIVTATISALLIATLAAAADRSRRSATGFALAGWIYFGLAFAPALGLRHNLLSDRAVTWLCAAIHDEEVPQQDYPQRAVFSPDGRRLVTSDSRNYGTRIWDVTTGTARLTVSAAAGQFDFIDFTDIGHGLWTLIVACLGGVLATLLGRRNPRTASSH
jgi:hypothetical protein